MFHSSDRKHESTKMRGGSSAVVIRYACRYGDGKTVGGEVESTLQAKARSHVRMTHTLGSA